MVIEIETKVLRQILETAEHSFSRGELLALDGAWDALELAERHERKMAREGKLSPRPPATAIIKQVAKELLAPEQKPDVLPPRKRGRPFKNPPAYSTPVAKDTSIELQNEIERLRAENNKLNKPKIDMPLKADNQKMYEEFNRGIVK